MAKPDNSSSLFLIGLQLGAVLTQLRESRRETQREHAEILEHLQSRSPTSTSTDRPWSGLLRKAQDMLSKAVLSLLTPYLLQLAMWALGLAMWALAGFGALAKWIVPTLRGWLAH